MHADRDWLGSFGILVAIVLIGVMYLPTIYQSVAVDMPEMMAGAAVQVGNAPPVAVNSEAPVASESPEPAVADNSVPDEVVATPSEELALPDASIPTDVSAESQAADAVALNTGIMNEPPMPEEVPMVADESAGGTTITSLFANLITPFLELLNH